MSSKRQNTQKRQIKDFLWTKSKIAVETKNEPFLINKTKILSFVKMWLEMSDKPCVYENVDCLGLESNISYFCIEELIHPDSYKLYFLFYCHYYFILCV